MSVRDQLLEDLLTSPKDWKLRGVLADWCEDNNQADDAACLRWMVAHQKRPYPGTSPTSPGTWFNAETVAPGLGDPESDIPAVLYEHLEGGKETAHHKTFQNARAAEEAILVAWKKAKKLGVRLSE